MSTLHTPFRYDYVGSFLRPDVLKQARADREAGLISAEQLRTVEDIAIRDLVAKQKAAGYHVITDGEFRRSYWHLDFMWGLNGVSHSVAREGYQFHGEETTADTAVVTGPIFGENHPFVEDYKFVKQFEEEGIVAKQTLPSPAQTLSELKLNRVDGQLESLRAVYGDDEEKLVADLAAAYRTVFLELYAAGCRNVQLDDCTWGIYCDKDFSKKLGIDTITLKKISDEGVRINNLALVGLPADLNVTTHVCRGNYHSTFAFSGGYDPVAPYLFAQEDVSAFYLEFDDARSGSFAPLAYVPEGKKVVLGLVTTKSPRLEDKDEVKARIAEAAKYVPLETLYLSPQCGFASCEIGNKLTEREQWAKLALVKEIAEEVWGE